jgi:hypothetical protein
LPAAPEAPGTAPDTTDLADVARVEIGTNVNDVTVPPWFVDGEIVPELMPEWIAVGNASGFVIGYKHLDPDYETMSIEELADAGDPHLLIYDAKGNVVGKFVDGVPTLDGDQG